MERTPERTSDTKEDKKRRIAMKIVFLDAKSIGEDIDLSGFDALGEVVKYDFTTDEEVPKRAADADIIIVNKVNINEKTIGGAEHVKMVCVTATGTNNLDKEYLESRKIIWHNVAGYSTESVTQHTFAMAFYLLEKLRYYDDYVKDEKYIDGFRGIYMPYWAYHVSQKGPVVLRGEKSKRRGDYIYTDHFSINGDMDCQYKGISFDASSSFDDNISEAIAPYDVKNMAGFTPAFLSGFYADTADVGCDVYMNDAIDMAGEETYDYVSNNIPLGGVSLHETESTIKSKCNAVIESVDRTLYPVWFLSYRNRDRVAYATVNGQTGKVSADLPVSIGRYFAGSALLAVPIFILLNMFFTLRPKVTLNVTAVIALITIILYVFELGKIKRRDQKLDDRGSWEESKLSSRRYKAGTDNDNLAKQMADGRNNARINRVSKKEKNKMAPLLKVVVIFAICMVGIPNFMFAFSLFSAVFSVAKKSRCV